MYECLHKQNSILDNGRHESYFMHFKYILSVYIICMKTEVIRKYLQSPTGITTIYAKHQHESNLMQL